MNNLIESIVTLLIIILVLCFGGACLLQKLGVTLLFPIMFKNHRQTFINCEVDVYVEISVFTIDEVTILFCVIFTLITPFILLCLLVYIQARSTMTKIGGASNSQVLLIL